MPAIELTLTAIEKLESPAAGQILYRDSDKSGLAVRVTPSGKKSYVVDKWDKERGRVARITIGDCGALTVSQARNEAAKILGQLVTGTNPLEERRKRQSRSITLEQVLEAYLRARKNLATRTVSDYRQLVDRYLADWKGRPLIEIDKDAIEKKHAEIGDRSAAQANYTARLLRALFNFACDKYGTEDQPFVMVNPVKRLSAAKAWYRVDRRQTYVKPTQLRAWFEAVANQDETACDYLQVLILTGLRRGEAMRLEWQHVDLAHKTLMVPDPKNKQPHTRATPKQAA